MQHRMYSIRDCKGEIFSPPYLQKTHGEAERSFSSVVNDSKSSINPYPEDYDLYYLGTFDDVTGKQEPLDTPQHVIKAIQVLKSVQ